MQIDLTVISLRISVIPRDFKSVLMFIGHFVCCLKKNLILFQMCYWVVWFLLLLWSAGVLHLLHVFMYVVHECVLHPLSGFSLRSWCVLVQNVLSLYHPITVFFLLLFFRCYTWQFTKTTLGKCILYNFLW